MAKHGGKPELERSRTHLYFLVVAFVSGLESLTAAEEGEDIQSWGKSKSAEPIV